MKVLKLLTLMVLIHNSHTFISSGKFWTTAYVEANFLDPSHHQREERVSNYGLICSLIANEISWVHLICFERDSCLMIGAEILPKINPDGLTNPVKCMTDQLPFGGLGGAGITDETSATTVAQTTETTEQTSLVPTTTQKPTTRPRPSLTGDNKKFFVSFPVPYAIARKFCLKNGAKPFVFKTEEEMEFTIKKTTRISRWAWLPLSDMNYEGKLVYEDGTAYEDAPYNPPFELTTNDDKKDCISINERDRRAEWSQCSDYLPMLCLKNE